MTNIHERRAAERRRTRRGGRRNSDPLSPGLRAEIDEYFIVLERVLAEIRTALDVDNVQRARDGAAELRAVSEAIGAVLATRRSHLSQD
jgi:hypothetical protein